MKTILKMLFLVCCTLSSLVYGEDRYAKNLDDVHAASCRVYLTNGKSAAIGTGTVVARVEGKYWVITNWHVVTGFNKCELHFFRDGKIFKVNATIQGSWHNEKAPWDFAILTVNEKDLSPYNPPIVPLGGKDARPLTDRPIFSSGCSEGRWSLAWKGSVEDYYGETAQFFPAPKQGQSGSSIVQNIDGQLRVTGILTWRVGDERSTSEENLRGGAIPISKFYDAASGRQRTNAPGINSVPPNSVWAKTEETQLPANPTIKTRPVLHLAAGVPVTVTYKNLILYAFTSGSCDPCKRAKPVIEKMKKEGFQIFNVSIDTAEGKASMTEQGITAVPTFLLHRLEGNSYVEKTRWTGADNLEEKIRMNFSRFGETYKEVPKEEIKAEKPKEEKSKAKAEEKSKEEKPKTDQKEDPEEDFRIVEVKTDDAEESGLRDRRKNDEKKESASNDSGAPGNVSPLLDLYGLSQPPAVSGEKEENKIFPFGKGNSDDSSVFGNDAKIQGIIDRIAGNLVSKLEETAKKKVQQYEPAVKEKIKEGADIFVDSAFKKSVTYLKTSYLLWLVGVMVIANLLSSAFLKLLGYLCTRDWPIKITFRKTKEEKTE